MSISDQEIYQTCLKRGYFETQGNLKIQKKDKVFSIMMPPPNVTGVLHIGHALTFSLQDIMVRYKRMQGYKTLYQPGLDHAGIATQNIVEKQLLAQNITKENLGREKFIQKVWQWKEESGGKILEQMHHLGITPAWSRARFTMDEGLANAVREAFVTWYEKGLITQGDYMVNWCTHDGALSDIEVEYEENHSKLYHLKYPIKDSKDFIIVATTRPETFFGDTAVMVHPEDKRYQHLIGKNVILPIINREIPIIADSHVDMEFGTGCVKVTPAHDINDYEVGKRHNLAFITTFDSKGILNKEAGEFEGLERLEAREKIVRKLSDLNFIEKIEDYTNQIGKCYRCGNVVEPYISKQWFVKKQIAQESIKKIQQNLMNFYPKEWKNNYNAWMRDLKDWCISRQLWWGHRIPVWYCKDCNQQFASKNAHEDSCKHCQSTNIYQDPDVLDTWFSSGLWAFSTLGWGNNNAESSKYQTSDLQEFYPNSLLITGFDILFFWVARMVFSGENLLHQLPFKDVYLHALVRDEFGQKMSKSKGNVIDPLDMIKTYGADNLRFSLAMLCAQGRDIKLSTKRFEDTQAFLIKLENAIKFLELYAKQQDENFKNFIDRPNLQDYQTPLGRYIKSQFNATTKKVQEELDAYRFNDAAMSIYSFLWLEFCDWGIELSKVEKNAVFELGSIFKDALKLLHPFMPFITEKLWHRLNHTNLQDTESIMISPYPEDFSLDEKIQEEFMVIKDCITSARRIKILLDLNEKTIEHLMLLVHKPVNKEMLQKFVGKCAKIKNVEILKQKLENTIADVGNYCESFLNLKDIDLSAIKKRLYSQRDKLTKEIEKLSNLLSNENFVKNAPAAVLATNQEGLKNAKDKLEKVNQEIQKLSL